MHSRPNDLYLILLANGKATSVLERDILRWYMDLSDELQDRYKCGVLHLTLSHF